MAAYFQHVPYPAGLGLAVLALLLVLGCWRSRRAQAGLVPLVWGALAGAGAYFLALVVALGLAQRRPGRALGHVEVLVRPLSRYGFPDGRLAVCGAVICALALGRRWALLVVAVLASGLLALAGVYVGVDFPSDVLGGAVFGAGVYLLGWPLASWVLARWGRPARAQSPYRQAGRGAHRGSAARPLREPGLPNTAAMEALRAASEAARARSGTGPGPSSAARGGGTEHEERVAGP